LEDGEKTKAGQDDHENRFNHGLAATTVGKKTPACPVYRTAQRFPVPA
jgi:hypothetical protein